MIEINLTEKKDYYKKKHNTDIIKLIHSCDISHELFQLIAKTIECKHGIKQSKNCSLCYWIFCDKYGL